MDKQIAVRLQSIAYEARSINAYEFRSIDASPLPAFTAGAHIDLHIAAGLSRSYSLVNSQNERHRYVVGVNRDPNSRGGSKHMHERLRAGDVITISAPRNNFELCESADDSLFIAGGVGITPFVSMVQRLEELGRRWRLYYAVRERDQAAFLGWLGGAGRGASSNITLHCDKDEGRQLSLDPIVASALPGTHLYCCGPAGMLEAFEKATAPLPSQYVHLEYFSQRPVAGELSGFTVVLARSGTEVSVPQSKSILDALLDAGIEVNYSCGQGICGSCETEVLEGIPEHRDMVLSEEERQRNRTLMICCSRSKTDRLVLNL